MILNPDQCYQAVLTRDARFDGRFFVAVKTTRIYCRPICRVKTPLRKNCRFFSLAAAAEAAGYRPCKRCRPELAPGGSLMEASSELARAAAQYISRDFLTEHSLADLARELGVTDRQMRRVFREAFGVSPVSFWQTQRLLLAKQLLTDSRMPITGVALASGFRSLRRFNSLLKSRYRLTPTELRKRHKKAAPDFPFRLSYRPPFHWEALLEFLSARAIAGVEDARQGAYSRTVRLRREAREFAGFLRVRHEPDEHLLAVRLSESLLPVCATVLERLKQLFDLHADPDAIGIVLGPLARKRPGLRVPGCFDGFEMAVRAILGQQVSVAAAQTLAGRVAHRFGTALDVPIASLVRLFPAPERIARTTVNDLGSLGITRKRAESIIALARAITSGRLVLEPGHRVERTLAELRKLPGVGEWTAQYIAMRALAWPDAFPHTDLGIRKALGEESPGKILQMTEQWRPWRAYAAVQLWSELKKTA